MLLLPALKAAATTAAPDNQQMTMKMKNLNEYPVRHLCATFAVSKLNVPATPGSKMQTNDKRDELTSPGLDRLSSRSWKIWVSKRF